MINDLCLGGWLDGQTVRDGLRFRGWQMNKRFRPTSWLLAKWIDGLRLCGWLEGKTDYVLVVEWLQDRRIMIQWLAG